MTARFGTEPHHQSQCAEIGTDGSARDRGSCARWGYALLVPVVLFALLWLPNWDSPGIYMDAVNPDYLMVKLLYTDRYDVPAWVLPGNMLFGKLPVMVNLYYGALTYYISLPVYALFGTDLFGVRLAGLWLGVVVLAALLYYMRGLRASVLAGLLTLLVLASNPAFILDFRTQFYITALPSFLILVALTLLSRKDQNLRQILLAGVLCGLSIYGYFIYFFPVALLTMLLLITKFSAQARRYWLAGLVLGLVPYVLGFFMLGQHAGGVRGFFVALQQILSSLTPGNSSLSLWGRLTNGLFLMQLGFDSRGNQLMILKAATTVPADVVRWVVLVLAVLSVLVLQRKDKDLRFQFMSLVAVVSGFLLLELTFGDRLWAHHFSSMPIWFAVLVGLSLIAADRNAASLGSRLAKAAACLLIASHVLSWRTIEAELVASGGRGTFSDAIVNFAHDVSRDARHPTIVAADWGILFPVAMVTKVRQPMVSDVNTTQIHRELCRGQDVIVALLVEKGTERTQQWQDEVAWGTAETRSFNSREGIPVLQTLTWRANAPNGPKC